MPRYDHDDFIFKKTSKTKIITNKHKLQLRRIKKQQANEMVDLFPKIIDTFELAPILYKYTLCIHKNLNLTKLKSIAVGFGAKVCTVMSNSVTHLIIEPKGDLRQLKMVHQAVSRGIVCTSSKWLLACYSKKRFCSPIAYQYDVNETNYALNQVTDTLYNPFHTTFIDYDAQEMTVEKGQLKIDAFLEPKSLLGQTGIMHSHILEDIFDDIDDDGEFINSTHNKETSTCLIEKSQQKETVKKKRDVSNLLGERLKIWYGEQEFYSQSSS